MEHQAENTIGASEASRRLNISRARLNVLLNTGRVLGAKKVLGREDAGAGRAHGLWVIPINPESGLPAITPVVDGRDFTNSYRLPQGAIRDTL